MLGFNSIVIIQFVLKIPIFIRNTVSSMFQENAKLQTECEEKSRKIEKLNESMTDLLTKNQS